MRPDATRNPERMPNYRKKRKLHAFTSSPKIFWLLFDSHHRHANTNPACNNDWKKVNVIPLLPGNHLDLVGHER